MAVHQPDVLGVPCQVFTVQLRVVNGDIFTLPEGVLGQNLGVVHLHVLAVLEHILGVRLQSVYVDVLREHKRIGAAVQLYVLQPQTVHFPECLVGIGDVHVLQLHVLHFAEELRTVYPAAAHHQVVGIPDGRSRTQCKVAVLNQCTVHVPPGVFAVEPAVLGLDVAALLDAALAVGYRDVLQSCVLNSKQRPFTAKLLVFD